MTTHADTLRNRADDDGTYTITPEGSRALTTERTIR